MLSTTTIEISYEYFYRKIYDQLNYRFNPTKDSKKISENFLLALSKRNPLSSLGISFLWRYSMFQYLYWKDLTIESFNKKVIFSYFFGNKALERYYNRNQDFDYLLEPIEEKFQSLFSDSKNPTIIEYYRNPSRLLYLNTDIGFATCIDMTTLYDHRDLSCIQCKYKGECKILLRTNYPRIYKQRGYKK